MTLEENKSLIRGAIEAMNQQKNLALIEELIAPEYEDHTNQLCREGAKQFYTVIFQGFPDYHRNIEDLIAEEDRVWVHSKTTATHTGEFRGVAPTGKKVTITGVNIYRISDGKIIEGWSVTDSTNLLKQLGLIQYTEKAEGILPENDVPQPSTPERDKAKNEKQPSISLEANKAIIRSLYEADNKRDWTILDELISPDFFEATLKLSGPDAYKQFTHQFFTGFPDWNETIKDIIAEGDKVWVYVKGTGTHTGEFWGLSPTGKSMTIKMVQMWCLVDEKVTKKRSVADELEAYQKAGLIKYTEKAREIFPEVIHH